MADFVILPSRLPNDPGVYVNPDQVTRVVQIGKAGHPDAYVRVHFVSGGEKPDYIRVGGSIEDVVAQLQG